MDVIDEGKLHSQVIDPAITRLDNETVPAIQAALGQVLTQGLTQLAGIVQTASGDVRAATTKATADLQSTIAGLDGWHLTITPKGPIFAITGAIEIELRAPKKEQS